jgi:hypothetical protein
VYLLDEKSYSDASDFEGYCCSKKIFLSKSATI